MASQKISEFNVSTSLSSSDLFTFVVNNTNKTISYSDFKLSLGVTGVLNQSGNPLAAPVLDAEGDNYNIRNIESSKGVIANVSAENGVVIGNNFSQTGTGEKVIPDLNADIYNIKTFSAGSNMAVTSDDETVTYSFVGSGGSSKTVPVSSMSDFPTPIAGVITLVADVDYLILNDLEASDRFVTTGNNTIRAASSQIVRLKYTGSGAMITGTEHNTLIKGITLSAPSGSLFDFSNAASTGVFQLLESNVEECDSIGEFNNLFILRIDGVGWEDIKTDGMLFSGVLFNVDLDRGIVFLNGGTFIDLGTSVLNEMSISKQILQLTSDPTATFLSGQSASANILSGGEGSVTDNRASVLTTPLSGVSPNDIRYEFLFNTGISDSMNDGLMYVEGSTTETVISSSGVKVKATNTWTSGDVSRFTFDANGRLTYIGEKSARLPIDVTSTLLMASGGDVQCNLCIAINGTVVTATCKGATVSSSKAASVSALWQHDFNNGDYVEVFVSNESNTVNIVVEQCIVRIN